MIRRLLLSLARACVFLAGRNLPAVPPPPTGPLGEELFLPAAWVAHRSFAQVRESTACALLHAALQDALLCHQPRPLTLVVAHAAGLAALEHERAAASLQH